MPEVPYIPQGTPITMTVEGYWDGLHNGNEPYMSYVGHDGLPRKVYVPHGALVQTNPERGGWLEFTVDKTPKAQPTYPDFSNPKLRVFRDNYNLTWWEVEPNKFHPADSRTNAEAYAKAWPKDYRDMAYLTEHYTLTDVTDTGEPLDAEKIPERFQCTRCDDSDGEYCAEHTYWSTRNAEFQRFWREYWAHNETVPEWAKDAPRKRGPQIGDTVAVPLNDENGTIIVGSLVATYDDKFWIEGDDFDLQVPHQGSRITVIEPARPAVPDEPDSDLVFGKSGRVYVKPGPVWFDPFVEDSSTIGTWVDLWHKDGPLSLVERGPVIGA
jgi:hypothetical protein